MIIFLYGPDSYHRQKKQKEVINQYQKKHSLLALKKFDLVATEDWLKLKDFLTAQSLFDELKMAVVENIFSIGTKEEKELIKVLKSHLENKNCYLLTIDSGKPKKDFKFLIEKPAINQEFPNLTGAAWQKFVDQEVKKRGLNPKSYILNSFNEGDCHNLINELEKALLSNLTIEQYNNFKLDTFPLIQKLVRGDLKTKLPLLEVLLNSEDSAKVFNLMAYLVSPEQQIKMADYDIAIKSGKLDYAEALTDLLIS